MSESANEAELRNAGLRVTLPRIRILEILEQNAPSHLSAEDVYKKLLASSHQKNVGLATVYRVLTQLEVAGIVERHNFSEGRSVFELASTGHHDHMIDIDNGDIIEFVNESIEKLQIEIAEKHGYQLIDHELVLYVRKK